MNHIIQETSEKVSPISETMLSAARAKQLTLTKPPRSLGKLEDIGNRLAAIAGTLNPGPMSKRIYVVAADHGVTAEGVSAYPSEVTAQMVHNFLRGGAAINALARHCEIELQIVDAGVAAEFPDHQNLLKEKIVYGTANMASGPAMTRAQAELSIVTGIKLARVAKESGIRILGIGEMGIGNTTSASAVTAVLTKRPVPLVTGRGAGIDDIKLPHKIEVIERSIEINRPDSSDPVDVLTKLGGLEIGVMTGLVIGTAAEGLPVVVDGFIATASAAIAIAICPKARDYLFLAHLSTEPGHAALIEHIRVEPLLSLNMCLGEGTGAALAIHLIEAASKLLSEMSTFDSAGVSNKQRQNPCDRFS